MTRKKQKTYWAGFSDGELHWTEANDFWGGDNNRYMPSIFEKKKDARAQYQDVRKVRILEVRS